VHSALRSGAIRTISDISQAKPTTVASLIDYSYLMWYTLVRAMSFFDKKRYREAAHNAFVGFVLFGAPTHAQGNGPWNSPLMWAEETSKDVLSTLQIF